MASALAKATVDILASDNYFDSSYCIM